MGSFIKSVITSGILILLRGVILLSDAMSCDYCYTENRLPSYFSTGSTQIFQSVPT